MICDRLLMLNCATHTSPLFSISTPVQLYLEFVYLFCFSSLVSFFQGLVIKRTTFPSFSSPQFLPTMSGSNSDEPNQPIHPSFLSKLDPQYLAFHNARLTHLVPPHTLRWDPAIRNAPAVPGGSDALPVWKVKNYEVGKTRVRTYTPHGEVPEGGWPVFIFFHGGGWTLGNISSEASFSTNMAVRAGCVVVSVDYRLAPENPYPAAVEDAVDSLVWVYNEGKDSLNINPDRIAVGGSSSGGNLATILAIKAKYLSPPIPLVFQLLIVPVTDNTASTSNRWASNALTPWLSPARMDWFKANYLPNPEDWTKWDASPIFATKEQLEGVPPAFVAVCELDILCEEGLEYVERLREAGVKVEAEVYRGAPHPIMAMDGVLDIGKKLVSDAARGLKAAFESGRVE